MAVKTRSTTLLCLVAGVVAILFLLLHFSKRNSNAVSSQIRGQDTEITKLVDQREVHTTEKPECQRFHLMTMFFSMHSIEAYANFTSAQKDERDNEFLEVLRSNLRHPCVEKIHQFYVKPKDLQILQSANLPNRSKLLIKKYHRPFYMGDIFIYASRNLLNTPVIVANGDIALGDGFEKVRFESLLKGKDFYTLSRYAQNPTPECIGEDMCKESYSGSHDTHIFALEEPLNETMVEEKLNFPWNIRENESVMIYVMTKFFKFRVYNPCYTLKTYHHHCSKVHTPFNKNYTLLARGHDKPTMRKARPSTLE